MKLPKTFVPDNWSEKVLENVLKGEQEKKEIKQQAKRKYKISEKYYEYYCDICGERAGYIKITPERPEVSGNYKAKLSCWPEPDIFKQTKQSPREWKLITKSFIGTTTMKPNHDFLESIIKHLDNGDLKSVLKKFKGNNLAFYCPTCDECYCGDHWDTKIVWEDFGWYDYTMGTCPKGHERMIDD